MSGDNRWPQLMQLALTRKSAPPPTAAEWQRDLKAATAATQAQLELALSADYDILGVIKTRGTTSVFRALRKSNHTEVKLQLVPAKNAMVVMALQQIRSPYVVGMQESLLLPDGTAVLISMQLQGVSLQETLLASDAPVSEAMGLQWMREVCLGMIEVAARNIVHRNLKPANILINASNAVCIDNFDCAQVAGNAAAGRIGTPMYMSPEQSQSPAHVDERSDIYSWGATFYDLVTGTHRVADLSTAELLRYHRPPRSPRVLNPDLSETTCWLIERCLALRPADRPQSFREVLYQLENPASFSFDSIDLKWGESGE